LIDILRRRIKDEAFIGLMWKFLNTGYMEQWKYCKTYSGTPQGSGISPILANIYLNELDTYTEEYKRKFSSPTHTVNPAHRNMASKIFYYKAKNDKVWGTLAETRLSSVKTVPRSAAVFLISARSMVSPLSYNLQAAENTSLPISVLKSSTVRRGRTTARDGGSTKIVPIIAASLSNTVAHPHYKCFHTVNNLNMIIFQRWSGTNFFYISIFSSPPITGATPKSLFKIF